MFYMCVCACVRVCVVCMYIHIVRKNKVSMDVVKIIKQVY